MRWQRKRYSAGAVLVVALLIAGLGALIALTIGKPVGIAVMMAAAVVIIFNKGRSLDAPGVLPPLPALTSSRDGEHDRQRP